MTYLSIKFLGGNMRVDLEEVWDIVKRRKAINAPMIEEIEWYEGGVKLEIDPKVSAEFSDIGLNNIDFITSGFYKKGWDKQYGNRID
jgi:hypothetical protein